MKVDKDTQTVEISGRCCTERFCDGLATLHELSDKRVKLTAIDFELEDGKTLRRAAIVYAAVGGLVTVFNNCPYCAVAFDAVFPDYLDELAVAHMSRKTVTNMKGYEDRKSVV